jgi:hypothetical protein
MTMWSLPAGALTLLLASGNGPALNSNQLSRGLAWQFNCSVTPEPNGKTYACRSVAPISSEPGPKTFLHFALTTRTFEDGPAAASAFDAIAAKANHNTGLSYAWDWVAVRERTLFHLQAPCLFSRANFEVLISNARSALGGSPIQVLKCACGGGCSRPKEP